MRIELLNGMTNVNGMSRVNVINGLSRVNLNGVTDLTSFVPDGYSLNGLSRVNLNGLSRVNLNGFVLNGFDVQDYMEECAYRGYAPTIPGLQGYMLNGKAERQARREKRKERKETRQARKEDRRSDRDRRREARTLRAEGKGERQAQKLKLREDKAASRGQFFDKIGSAAGNFAEKYANNLGENAIDDYSDIYVDDFTAEEKGLFSPPKLWEDPVAWFGSKKVPTIQKVGVVAGAVVTVDALTGGNIILQRIGVMKPKTKKRR